jgi:methyl-accepting chemotaxis protein
MTTIRENRPQHQRRTKFIDRDFQVGLILKFILANTAILAIFGATMYLFLRAEIQSNLQSAHASYRTMGAMLLPIVLTLTLLVLAILSVAIVFVVLYASHRIAGPMYRFHHVLREMGEGNLDVLTRIRENDQLGEVAMALQGARDRWANDVGQLRQLTGELGALLPTGEVGVPLRRKLDEVLAFLARYRT